MSEKIKLSEGILIIWEGLNGAGKSTQMLAFAKWLRSFDFDVLVTDLPTHKGLGAKARQILGKELSHPGPLELQKLMAKDREVHLREVIQPHLDKGGIVLCGRYYHSGFAFGQAEGVALNELRRLDEDCRKPNLTIYIDSVPEVSMHRLDQRIENSEEVKSIYEQEVDFQAKVGEYFKKLPEICPEMVIVDGSGTKEEIFELTLPHVQKALSMIA